MDLAMTPAVALQFFGSCIGVGCLLGGLVSILNSWLP